MGVSLELRLAATVVLQDTRSDPMLHHPSLQDSPCSAAVSAKHWEALGANQRLNFGEASKGKLA